MPRSSRRTAVGVGAAFACLALPLLVALVPAFAARGETPAPDAVRFFETRIRPLLVEHCQSCHGERLSRGHLRLDSREAILKGGSRGAAIVPGQPAQSLLLRAVSGREPGLKMPPGKPLTREQIADLTRWVQLGAPWPAASATPTSGTRRGEFRITAQDRAHWAFQPLRRPTPPAVKQRAWVRNPIDAFVLARLEARGLAPNPPATRYELIRRAYYDLIGLPPKPEEVEAFVRDPAPDAYERLIDRLLASPHYGEKWGRHWLDLVRYAETNSYERDNPKPNAWRYRDYVIRSFNDDKPYDRFILEQLAGDELPDGGNDGIVATGFYRLGIWDDEPTDRELAFYDGVDDLITTTGQVFLGLTLDCARCHDHKIDPISQKDYYRFLAFFRNINHFRNGGPTDERPLFTSSEDRQAYEAAVAALQRRRQDLEAQLNEIAILFRAEFARAHPDRRLPGDPVQFAQLLEGPEGIRLLGEERARRHRTLREEIERLRRERVPIDRALCITEAGRQPPETFVLLRGNPAAKGEKVEPGFPEIFNAPPPTIEPPANGASSGRRLALARWIASPENPLTARVMANRVWQYHFGRGIVRSANNFGLQGDRPTHPELLDWLATELIRGGWRLKPLHRLIMTSNTYRMSSRGNARALQVDPENDLFWRFNMRRLTAEEIRDSILCVTGVFNPKMYGPSIYVDLPAEVLATQSMPGRGWGKSPPEEQARRSIYIHVKRSLLVPILEVHDLAETDRTTPVRFASTQPTQALLMLNSEFMNQQATRFAERLRREAGEDPRAQVRLALHLATQRPPTPAEIERGVRLIASLQEVDRLAPDVALRYFCLMVLNLNEFVYLD